jgi:hypothetical protein
MEGKAAARVSHGDRPRHQRAPVAALHHVLLIAASAREEKKKERRKEERGKGKRKGGS